MSDISISFCRKCGEYLPPLGGVVTQGDDGQYGMLCEKCSDTCKQGLPDTARIQNVDSGA
jgi:hypothetical protein